MERQTSTKENFYAIIEFEDGLQIIPNKWLSADLKRAVWPNFTNNARYDRAVKLMEEPQSTWLEHPISKIYGTYLNYMMARKKLKEAEELSDLNSGTDRDEFLKKSRKIRAAKIFDEDTSNDEQSDDTSSLISDLPKVPEKRTNTITTKGAKVSQTDCNYVNNPKKKFCKEHKLKDTRSWTKSQEIFSGHHQDNFREQCDEPNLLNMDTEQSFSTDLNANEFIETQFTSMHSRQNQFDTRNTDSDTRILSNLTNKPEQSFTTNLNSGNEFIETQFTNMHSRQKQSDTTNMILSNLKRETENFQRFVVGKLINLELKINSIERNQKQIIEKLPITDFKENEDENIDIFQDLPLKNKNDVEAMETKLINDKIYRSQMIKQLVRVTCKDLKTSCIHLMRKVFSNNAAVHYSWYGAKKKQNFSQLQICQVIMCVIRKLHPNAIDEEISAPIKIWLAHAKERMGREKEQNMEDQE
ncbi:uncharacterized protein LOC115243221 isoform X2 [Formica exsecta]|uniref:uncharacterized protein LOC115243221 isoform X2 n=1 Tax=Formica exsecta TaxID=72781 RepID=UPI00114179C6|nr:uncharacterized protein LOC115243221 isoform X2 [Formica exsecta]XP_029675889.1 uncharacterized protein LOC115243221 isoform X2 [Formica exsecta]XP_029675890.1 uncharacterized protein LOC115243221 isoform X2 [Formica exsecta]